MASVNASQPFFKSLVSGRKIVLLSLILVAFIGSWILGPIANHLPSHSDGFFSAALHPTLTDQNQSLPTDATPFFQRILREMATTLRYALVAMSLAVPAGMILGFLASTVWWPQGANSSTRFSRLILRPLHWGIRLFITLIRSIHELIWGIFFLSAIGD